MGRWCRECVVCWLPPLVDASSSCGVFGVGLRGVPMTVETCPVLGCGTPLHDKHDDPRYDAVCGDCCLECNTPAPGDCVEVRGHGPGVVLRTDRSGTSDVLFRWRGSGEFRVEARRLRRPVRVPVPSWLAGLAAAFTAAGEQPSLFDEAA